MKFQGKDLEKVNFEDTEGVVDPVERQAIRTRLVDAVWLSDAIARYGAKAPAAMDLANSEKLEVIYPRTEDLLRLDTPPVQITLGKGNQLRIEVESKKRRRKDKKRRQRVAVGFGKGKGKAKPPKRGGEEGLPLRP